tara:strand:- start:80 stop:547 length:468 start_codon:yes stop_codon:yes gene_type:complete
MFLQKILKILIYLNLSPICKFLVPKDISFSERIGRYLFYPSYINSKKEVKPLAFKPDPDTEEVSTSRLNFIGLEYFIKLAFSINRRKNDFRGFAVLTNKEIVDIECNVIYTPNRTNAFHSDILMGYISVKGKPMDGQLQERARKMAEKCEFIECI